jgi:hypothetical protein
VVVDLLNLTHWLGRAPTAGTMAEVILATAPVLLERHSGRVVYVGKDQTSKPNTADNRAVLARAAAKASIRVYVAVAERAPEFETAPTNSAGHTAKGRDDMYMAVLADRYKCAVLSEDRLRDFNEFRHAIQPFRALEFAGWRGADAPPVKEYIRPSAYTKLPRPRMSRYAMYPGLVALQNSAQ